MTLSDRTSRADLRAIQAADCAFVNASIELAAAADRQATMTELFSLTRHDTDWAACLDAFAGFDRALAEYRVVKL